jgi:hypothetical protein
MCCLINVLPESRESLKLLLEEIGKPIIRVATQLSDLYDSLQGKLSIHYSLIDKYNN